MIDVKWANPEKTIVIWEFSSGWTWEAFFEAKQRVDTMIDGVDGIVDSIFMTSPDQKLPPRALTNLRTIIANRHARHDTIVLVGPKRFLTTLLNTVIRLIPTARKQIFFTQAQEDAYAIIAKAQQRRQDEAEEAVA